jgi:exopolysaccharide production repressor protein
MAMSLPLFFRGLLAVVAVFAVVTYLISGSVWTTFIDTVICAILLQVGYFAVVLFMVWRTPPVHHPERGIAKRETAQGIPREEQTATKVVQLPGTPTSPQP